MVVLDLVFQPINHPSLHAPPRDTLGRQLPSHYYYEFNLMPKVGQDDHQTDANYNPNYDSVSSPP